MKLITHLSLMLFIFVFPFQTTAYDHGDWQFWNTERLEGELAEKWKLCIEQQFRFGDDMAELYFHHTDIGVRFTVRKWLDTSMHYRHIYELKSGEWMEENRPHLNFTLKWSWKGFRFSDRNRGEIRLRRGKDEAWRYRNKFTVKYPVDRDTVCLIPYISDEVYWDFERDEYSRNRLYTGITLKIWKILSVDMHYLLQSSKSNDKWSDANVLGLKLSLKF